MKKRDKPFFLPVLQQNGNEPLKFVKFSTIRLQSYSNPFPLIIFICPLSMINARSCTTPRRHFVIWRGKKGRKGTNDQTTKELKRQ